MRAVFAGSLALGSSVQPSVQKIDIVDYVIGHDFDEADQILKNNEKFLFVGEKYNQQLANYILCCTKFKKKVVRKNGCLAGMVLFSDGTVFVSGEEVQYGLLDCIAVAAEFRKQGIGRALFVHAVRELFETHKQERVFLAVNKDNKPARALYESVGFKLVDAQLAAALQSAWKTTDSDVHYQLVKKDFIPYKKFVP